MNTRIRQRLFAGAAAIALLAGATGITSASARMNGHDGPSMDPAMHMERMERRADHMLDKVNATADQKAKVHAIIEAMAKDIDPIRKSMSGTRDQMRTLLTAPQIDRAAIEALRAQRSAQMDQMSQRMTKALADAAEVLTPEQRQKIAALEAKHEPRHKDGMMRKGN